MAAINGIGTDLVRIPRMNRALGRHGDRFARRILAPSELNDFHGLAPSMRPAFLAKRFAAKEAAAKALGTGFRDGLGLRDIGVGHDSVGRPSLELRGRARSLARMRGITDMHVSLSDDGEYALAFVVFSGPTLS